MGQGESGAGASRQSSAVRALHPHSGPDLSSRQVEQLLESTTDVPPPPASYNEYVERKLRECAREAYMRGFNRGRRHELMVLFAGMLFGCVLGFYVAVTSQ